jgi:cysteine-rich repeat protein
LRHRSSDQPFVEVQGGVPEGRRLFRDWSVGDVFAGVGDGKYNVFSNTGVFKETISHSLGGYTAGCAFNRDRSKLYTAAFSADSVVVFDAAHPHTIVQTISSSREIGTLSIVFDAAGNFFVGCASDFDGLASGGRFIRKYNAAGTLLDTYSAAGERRGADWIDLAEDQCTLFYTSVGRKVKRYDICTKTQLADFATLPGPGYAAAFRLLPPGDGTGGLLVVDYYNIKRLDGMGNIVKKYDITGEDGWFPLSLDPDGTSFWAGDSVTKNFYRFDIASGSKLGGPFPSLGSSLLGMCVFGAVTTVSRCGDGIVQDGEMCDDGNVVSGDGCSALCQLEINNCTITFNLYNSMTDSPVAPLTGGTTIANPPPCRQMNIEAVVPCGNVGNVTLQLFQGSQLVKRKIEHASPYFLFGNADRNVSDGTIVPGKYGIRVRVNGTSWSPFTNFTMGGQCG